MSVNVHNTRFAEAPKRPVIPGPMDVLRFLGRAFRRAEARRQVEALLAAEERQLKDIGVTRLDVVEALSTPGDPAATLHRLAARHRKWARQSRKI